MIPTRFWISGWTKVQAKHKAHWHTLHRDPEAQKACGYVRDEIARRVVYALERHMNSKRAQKLNHEEKTHPRRSQKRSRPEASR